LVYFPRHGTSILTIYLVSGFVLADTWPQRPSGSLLHPCLRPLI
jgi:hypothetical protein